MLPAMVDATKECEWQSRKIKNWLLALLRFAVTHDETDRICVIEMARDLDCQNSGTPGASFSYFDRITAEICNVIVADQNARRQAILLRLFNHIDDCRLRRALEAATECRPSGSTQKKAVKHRREHLWKGLR
jgi:hypothetical protein